MLPAITDYASHIAALAASHGNHPALLVSDRAALTFAAVADRIDAMRSRLAPAQVGPGRIVAWPTEDRVESAAALAILPGCCVLAPLDPALTVEAYAALLARLMPAAVVVPKRRDHPIALAAASRGVPRFDLVPMREGPAGEFDLVARGDPTAAESHVRNVAADVFAITCTSGTTGWPKLVPHSWPKVHGISRAVGERLAIRPDDVSAHITPLHLANGIRNAFTLALVHGAAVRVLPEADVNAFLAAIDAGEVTYTTASFAIQREVLRRLESGRSVRPGRMRFVRVASGPMSGDEMDRLEHALGVPVITGLASSETGAIALQRLPPEPRTRGACGDPVAAEVRIADATGAALPPGESGEIQVRGEQVFEGYLDDDDLTAAVFVDGWFRTGDLGRLDARGDLHVVGRLREMINRGGEKIAPAEIDAILRTLPGVVDAAAFALPHPRLGEEVAAAVVREPGAVLRAEDVIASVRAKIGARRAPKQVWFVDTLPRTGSGKVARYRLPAIVGFDSGFDDANPPTDPTPFEAAVAQLWASLLGLDRVPRDATFAALGGTAPLAERLRRDVRAAFEVDLPGSPAESNASSVSEMARWIAAAREGSDRHA